MKVEIFRSDFSDINTVILYKIDTYSKSPVLDKIIWKASNTYTGLEEFEEYDFSFDVKDSKYNNHTLLSNYLDNNSLRKVKDKINSEVLDTITKFMFPTTSLSSPITEDRFFGSTLANNKLVYLIPVSGISGISNITEKGIWKIELYEEFITVPKDANPCVEITLGPPENARENNQSLYSSSDPLFLPENREQLGFKTYTELYEEWSNDKVVIVSLSQKEGVEVNLSYKAWNLLKDPNRKMKDYTLRRDKFLGTYKYLKTFDQDPDKNVWIDKRNGTLLGIENIEYSNLPILSRKLNRLGVTIPSLSSPSRYSPYTVYHIGDRVIFGRRVYESISDNNCGNYPTLSTKWILSSFIENIFTKRISLQLYPDEAGNIKPGQEITVKNAEEEREFRITEALGYELNSKTPVIFSDDLSDVSAYINEDDFYLEDNVLKIKNWSKGIESGIATFLFNKINCSVILRFSYNGSIYTYPSEWLDWLREPVLNLSTQNLSISYGDDKIKYFSRNDKNLAVVSGLESSIPFTVNIPFLEKYQPTSMNFTSDNYGVDTILPTKTETNWTFPFSTKYTTTIATVDLILKKINIEVLYSSLFEVDKSLSVVDYGTSKYDLYFYSNSETMTPYDWDVEVMVGDISQVLEYRESKKQIIGTTLRYTYTEGVEKGEGIYKVSLEGDITTDIKINIKSK